MFKLENEFFEDIEDILIPVEFVGSKKKSYANVSSSFDIEASSFYIDDNKNCCMYAWVFGINGRCIRGRTWGEFQKVLARLVVYYGLNENRLFIIYVHNLSYEFQWFRRLFEWKNVFSLEQREPVYATTTSGIQFRCSYKLSGLSLRVIGENLRKYKVQKMVGDLDYDLVRHSSTPLTDKEWGYILNDGLVVMAYIQELIEKNGTIKDIPLTKTGFVRRLCRDNCLKGDNKFRYSKLIKNLTMSLEDYKQLKQAFAGGFTHANHNHVYKERRNVSSYDFTSSYPSVLISEKFPMSKAEKVNITNKEDFIYYISNFCCLFDMLITDVESIYEHEHYISKSKCLVADNALLDNGRVISADTIVITITDVDYRIIRKTYKWSSIKVANFKIFRKDYLPKEFILTILKLYGDKTTLKNVEGQEENYLSSKEMLNSMYGMCVTDPCKDEVLYDDENEWQTNSDNEQENIDRYNNSNTRFLFYAWGIWTTAYARKNLWTGILEFNEDYIYSDTDSLKVLNVEKHLTYIKQYNELVQEKIKQCLSHYHIPTKLACPKTIKGIEKPLGVWDFEGTYSRFKTLGAKRYMYVQDDKLHITIAGVAKLKGSLYLQRKYKTFDKIFAAFREQLVFPATYEYKENGETKTDTGTGKLTHTYIDTEIAGYIVDYRGQVSWFHEMSGVHLEPASYDLSLEMAFLRYVLGIGSEFWHGE